MYLRRISCVLATVLCLGVTVAYAQNKFQEIMNRGVLSGNIQIDAQYYQKDTATGAADYPEKVRSNSYAYLQYTNGRFTMGARFEGYFKPMAGYDARYDGYGIPYYFARFSGDIIDVTAGSFYEQFGSGLILRSYQDWNLGLDNAIRGVRAIVTPTAGVTLKGLIGTQRYFWESKGMIRGLDADLAFNEFIRPMKDWNTRISIGGSFVSKYEEKEALSLPGLDPVTGESKYYSLNLPQNVGSFAARMNLESHGFTFSGEYVRKFNDPSAENGWIYKPGQAMILNMGYSMKGFGVLLSAKSVDNMGYRISRQELGNYGMINYLPALSRQHTYSLASFYPYACQPNGEVGFQADVIYKVPRKTIIGGRYGMDIKLNVSVATSLKQSPINDINPIGEAGTRGYNANLFGVGDDIYFFDVNLELSRRFGKNVKATVMYMYQIYNQEVVEGHGEPEVNAHIAVADVSYKFLKKHSLRLEIQYMHTKQVDKDWIMGTLEYTFAPSWFVSVSDMWNFGNDNPNKRLHYYNASVGYVHNASRFSLSYGRIRDGIMCAGGVCRQLPASTGLMLSITSSF